jgi:ATP-dependent DNA ligase
VGLFGIEQSTHASETAAKITGQSAPAYPPMEAQSVDEITVGEHWQYEPKWDGFRCLIFRNGASVELQSKSGRSLTRYFPELADEIASLKISRFVVDGEIVVPQGRGFSFDALLQRIHPAQSRVHLLAQQTPARILLFDLLALEGELLTGAVLATQFMRWRPDKAPRQCTMKQVR